jgi:hypothetical protein
MREAIMNRPQGHFVSLLVIAVLVLGASHVRALLGAGQLIDTGPRKRADFVDLQRRLWTWPPTATPAGAPFNIGILGNDPFQQGEINHLDRKLQGVRNIRVLRFANVDAIAPCHILVVSKAANLKPALTKTEGQPVLVIAQESGLAREGAVLSVPVVGNRLKIELNMTAAEQAGLTPHPGLVRLADEVIR